VGFTTIRRRVGKKKSYGKLDDVGGQDLLVQFHAWVSNLEPDALRDELRGRYIRVTDVQAVGRTVLVKLDVGRFGEPGSTYHVYTHEVSHRRTADEASGDESRLLFTVPQHSTFGLFAVESVAGSAGGSDILSLFKAACLNRWGDDYWPLDRVYEKDDWLALASLKQLSAIYYKWANDIGDDATPRRIEGRMERHLFPAKRDGSFPARVWDSIRQGEVSASQVFGAEVGDDEEPTILARVQRGGREKQVELGHERTPTVRVVMTDSGQEPYNDARFRDECIRLADEMYHDMSGHNFPNDIVRGAWDDEDLNDTWG
jgi:hypothetical protein